MVVDVESTSTCGTYVLIAAVQPKARAFKEKEKLLALVKIEFYLSCQEQL